MSCLIKECEGKEYCKGLCSKHYNRLLTRNTLIDGPRARASVEERFWRNVNKSDGCWEWTGKSKIDGYGIIGLGGRKTGKILAHRLSWIIHHGPIPDGDGYHGTVIMHTCDNRGCVNPGHLFRGTQADNIRDMDSKGRRVNRQLKGSKHNMAKLTEDNVRYIRSSPKTNVDLATEFNMTRQAIRYARVQGWKHV